MTIMFITLAMAIMLAEILVKTFRKYLTGTSTVLPIEGCADRPACKRVGETTGHLGQLRLDGKPLLSELLVGCTFNRVLK